MPVVWHVVVFAPFGVVIAVSDWRWFVVPDRWVVSGAVAVAVARLVWPGGSWWAVGVSVVGAIALFGVARVIAAGRLGWGDVKLAGLLAFALGGVGWVIAMFVACIGALGWLFLAHSSDVREARVPFGTFMVVGALVCALLFVFVSDVGYVG
jgi:Flp pilus assembly protein protease CpaA